VSLTVAWPYITLKVHTDDGLVLRSFYAGAPVPANADRDDLARLVRKGAIAGADAAPEPAEPDDRPKDYAPKPEWVEYAVSKRADGVAEDEARAAAEARTQRELIAEFGG
jgi:hypothetical protein